jgi:hypothetical protein
MIDKKFLDVLRIIYERLQDTDIDWTLTGSLSFALQGLPVSPHDIDIQTDKRGAYEIERLLSECVTTSVEFSSTDKIRSHLGELTISGIKVEIMGDIEKRLEDGTWESPVDIRRYRTFIEIEGMHIPVLSLEYEYEAYLKLGRKERAAMLKKWLDENT